MVKHPRDRGVLALITDAASTPDDHDMAPLVEACTLAGIEVQVVDWTDHTVDWRTYSAAVLRSPWSYTSRLSEFLSWCEHAATLTDLWNPWTSSAGTSTRPMFATSLRKGFQCLYPSSQRPMREQMECDGASRRYGRLTPGATWSLSPPSGPIHEECGASP